MILTNPQEVQLERSEGIDTKAFSFDEQSIGLMINAFLRYANPIGALIRELVSNAYDANIEAKSEEPIIVSLESNGSDYNFIVQDSGIGMSKETLENIYIKFGASTKRNSNEVIGAYGLGSKAPLGYSDYFICETVKDGLKNTVVITKTGNIPDANFVDESFTTEPNGTRITVPVKRSDYYSFVNETKSQLRYFDNVMFLGDINVESDIIKGENFITNIKFLDKTSKIHICMGKVYYPLRLDLIFTEDFNILPKSKLIKKLVESNIGLYFDIGEIDVIWNREDISYTKENIVKIIDKLSKVYDRISDIVSASLNYISEEDLLYSMVMEENDIFSNMTSVPEQAKKLLKLVRNPLDYYTKNEELVKIAKLYLEKTVSRKVYSSGRRKKVNTYTQYYNSEVSYYEHLYEGSRPVKDIEAHARLTYNTIVHLKLNYTSFSEFCTHETIKKELRKIYYLNNKNIYTEEDIDEETVIDFYSATYQVPLDNLISIYCNKLRDKYVNKITSLADKKNLKEEKNIRVIYANGDIEKGKLIDYSQISDIITRTTIPTFIVICTFELKYILKYVYKLYSKINNKKLIFVAVSNNSYSRLMLEEPSKKAVVMNLEEVVRSMENTLVKADFYYKNYELFNSIFNYSTLRLCTLFNNSEQLKKEISKVDKLFVKLHNDTNIKETIGYLLKEVQLDSTYRLDYKIKELAAKTDVIHKYNNEFISYVDSYRFKKEWSDIITYSDISLNLHSKYKEKNGVYKVFKNSNR